MVERLDYKRAGLALIAVAALVMAMVAIMGGAPAYADHIDGTGGIQSNCVEFQAQNPQETGTKSPSSFPEVDIAVVSWDDPNDPHSFDFTISGLASGQHVDISVKSGNEFEEPGPYGNGSHTYDSLDEQAISHIRLCVFEEPVETTTTTVPEETTTVPEETTTVPEETTTTVEETTTTTVEILETTLTTAPAETTSSSVADTVLGTEVLPFTGVESEWTFWLATILALTGGLLVYGAKRAED